MDIKRRLDRALIAVAVIVLGVAWAVGLGIAYAGEFGSAWSEQGTDALPVATSRNTAAVLGGKIFSIGGLQGASEVEKVYSSSDGTTWAEEGTDALLTARAFHCSVTFNAKLWLIAGEDSGTSHDNVYSSSDGATWAEEGADAFTVNLNQHACAVKDSKIWVIGGFIGASPTDDVYSSPDGTTWTLEGQIPSNLASHAVVVLDDVLYVIGGYDGTNVDSDVYASADGVTWTTVGTIPAVRRWPGAVSAGGKIYVFGGSDQGGTVHDNVYVSSDGANWAEVGDDALTISVQLTAYAMFQGKAYQVGGESPSATRKVHATDDLLGLVALPNTAAENEFAQSLTFADQSTDTATNQLPFIEIAQQVQTDSGFPFVTLMIISLYVGACIGAIALFARLAPDNKFMALVAVLAISAVGFALGREAIPWYVFLSVAGASIGLTAIQSRVPG